jgi:nucleotide-binding universal stress UspA family protein
MFKRILLPTDGSELSRQTVLSGIVFAHNTGATVVGIHVVPQPHPDQLQAWMHHDPHFEARRQALFDKFADESLSFIGNCALAQSVSCICKKVREDHPWQAIVKAAQQERCDLIYMASHGWFGSNDEMLGSETLKVLHASKVPVMVFKAKPGRPGTLAGGATG